MPADSAATLLLAGARLIWYAGCLVVIGAAAFRTIARRLDDLDVPGWMQSAAGIGCVGALILLSGTALRLYAQTYSLFGLEEPVTPALLWLVAAGLPPWSTGWALQLTASLTAATAFGIARGPSGRAWPLAQLAAAAVALTMPLTGHAVAQPGWYVLPIALQAGHALGAGAWLGGLFVLLVVTRGAGRSPVARLVEAFSPVALAGAGLLTLSGAGTTLLYLDRTADLVDTPYGRALLWKLALFAGVAMLGLVNWRYTRPRLLAGGGTNTLTRTAGAELALAAVVLAITAVLTGLPQPAE